MLLIYKIIDRSERLTLLRYEIHRARYQMSIIIIELNMSLGMKATFVSSLRSTTC